MTALLSATAAHAFVVDLERCASIDFSRVETEPSDAIISMNRRGIRGTSTDCSLKDDDGAATLQLIYKLAMRKYQKKYDAKIRKLKEGGSLLDGQSSGALEALFQGKIEHWPEIRAAIIASLDRLEKSYIRGGKRITELNELRRVKPAVQAARSSMSAAGLKQSVGRFVQDIRESHAYRVSCQSKGQDKPFEITVPAPLAFGDASYTLLEKPSRGRTVFSNYDHLDDSCSEGVTGDSGRIAKAITDSRITIPGRSARMPASVDPAR